MRKFLLRTLMTLAVISGPSFFEAAYASAPAGYYNSLVGKKESALKTAAHDIIYNFTEVSSYSALPSYFEKTDVYPDSKRWWDMYSDIPFYAPSFSGLNREHSFPKSWWGGLKTVSAYVDLNHLYPSEMKANTAKSNYPLGEVSSSSVSFNNGICKVGAPKAGQGGGAAKVFEPADEYKGDFARTYFYMVTCYQNLTWKYFYMVSQNLYPTLNGWSVDLLMKWHRADPVSQKELDRNEAVYKIQNNRNPFIDHPELAEYLWGNKKGQAFTLSGGTDPNPPVSGDPELLTPTQDMDLDFGEVVTGSKGTAKLIFKGNNITGKINVRIRKQIGDAEMFSLEKTSIDGSAVNVSNGYELNVYYTPTSKGKHTARILITVDGIAGSRGLEIRGEGVDKPVLDQCTALPATDITEDSYVANWTTPADNVVDYWVINRTKFKGSDAVEEEVLAESDGSQKIMGLDESDYETYTVQSCRLGFKSPVSNIITVRTSGINDIKAGAPLSIIGIEGAVRFITNGVQTDVRFFDVSGRLLRVIDRIDNYTEVEAEPGFYLISTREHKTPVKVVVK